MVTGPLERRMEVREMYQHREANGFNDVVGHTVIRTIGQVGCDHGFILGRAMKTKDNYSNPYSSVYPATGPTPVVHVCSLISVMPTQPYPH